MAGAGVPCQWGDNPHSAVHLITNIETGTVVGLCEDHFAPGLIPVLAFNLGVDASELYKAIEKFVAAETKKAALAADAARAAAEQDGQGGDHDDPAERDDVAAMRREAAVAAGDDWQDGGGDVA